MLESERRTTRRLIMKVPLKFHAVQKNGNNGDSEQSANAMNICSHGVYFATEQKLLSPLAPRITNWAWAYISFTTKFPAQCSRQAG